MQTPLQMLIEWIKQENIETPFDERWNPADDIIRKATELLEKEREVIEDAYWNGSKELYKDGFDYFTKTFTDESK